MSDVTAPQPAAPNQGSLWRRWDPHVHLPGTLFNDQFDGMSVEDALKILADAEPAIEAIGVTDYFTTASYRRAAAALENVAAPSIRLAFPNVELRLDNATSSNRGVNIHLLCPPEEVDGLDRFIGALEFSWADVLYRADSAGLIQLGRDYSQRADLAEADALKIGATQFKVNFEGLRRQLLADRWAKENILIAVAGGEGDGTSGIRDASGAFAARRQSIEALADIVFSGNPKQAEFWSGDGTVPEHELERVYGGLKPCLHGSDAHDALSLGAPDNDRFCWLNGDPTFDTLRLACLSPTTRVRIGPESPSISSTYGRIIELSVPASEWFVDQTVALNPGLVAIIGARGSGKTALADLVAAGAGSTEPFDNESSFVSRAGRLIRDSLAAVEWSQGETTTCNFAEGQAHEPFFRPVRYLSQQFVERLCASDGVSDELLTEIERVIFEAWPIDQRQGAATFRELLMIRLTAARERQSIELETVVDFSNRITEMRLRHRALQSQRDQLEEQRGRLGKLDAAIARLTKNADEKNADRLVVVSEALRERQKQTQQLDRRRTGLEGLQSAVRSARSTSFPQNLERLRDRHSAAGLAETEWNAFKIDFAGDVEGILNDASKEVGDLIEVLAGTTVDDPEPVVLDVLTHDDLLKRPINELEADAERLRALVGLDASRDKDLKRFTEAASEARTRIEKLTRDIEQTEKERPNELVDRRLAHYEAYFTALLEGGIRTATALRTSG